MSTGGLRYPPFAKPREPVAAGSAAIADEIRPIEEFLDTLPPIDEFLLDDESESVDDVEEWAADDWQTFNWQGVASLGQPAAESVVAEAEWSNTDWSDEAQPPVIDSAAEEIAAALDDLAWRIRSGEIVVGQLHGTTAEAAMAAALAALLRSRG